MKKKKILLLSDDCRMHSGVATVSSLKLLYKLSNILTEVNFVFFITILHHTFMYIYI